jgi:NitT/TauT family transport system substrate-binding protein
MKRLLLTFTVLIVSIGFAFADSTLHINVAALKGPTGIGMVRLFDSPPDLGAGIGSTFSIAPSPDAMVAKLLKGEADFATLPTDLAAKLYVKKVGYALLAVVGDNVLYLVTDDASTASPKDLAGKEIFLTGQGATPEYALKYLLLKAPIDPASVTLNYSMQASEIAQSMIAGRVHNAVLPEPFVTLALRGSKSLRIAFDVRSEWVKAGNPESFPMSCVVVRKDLLEKSPVVVKAFAAAYADSIAWVKANPADAGRLVEKYDFGMKAPIAAEAIPRCGFVFVPASNAKPAVLQFLSVFFGFSPDTLGKLPDDGFFASF